MTLVRIFVGLALLLLTSWGTAAIWIDGPDSRLWAGATAGGFALAALAAIVFTSPFAHGASRCGLLGGLVLGWWLGIEPSNDRVWLADVARPPRATVDGSHITVENVRNFEYRSETDWTPHWERRSYDLDRMTGVDFFLVYWGSPMIAHTIVSWTFEDSLPLAISIETRKEQGEEYSALLGFFRQFELYYVTADERDVIGLRTNFRNEDVYLYPLKTPLPIAKAILLDYLDEINAMADHPRWYNALTHNCTTTIRHHVRNVAPDNPFSWKVIVNGYIDELGYERGTLDTSLPFDELKRRSRVNEVAKQSGLGDDFSARIRAGLPNAERSGK